MIEELHRVPGRYVPLWEYSEAPKHESKELTDLIEKLRLDVQKLSKILEEKNEL